MDDHSPHEVTESEESEGRQESEPDDTQEQPNKKRRRNSSEPEDVKSKAKKTKKEAVSKRPRGRPRKNPEVTRKDKKARNLKKSEKEFSVVAYVEVAVPHKLHAGKTHKGDKMVPQAPRRCGPFSMFRRTKWTNFLENIAAVTGIDKENLLLPGMTWRMQGKKERDGLPLQSRDAFKAMRDILKNKTQLGKEQPVLIVHHPITTTGTSRGRQTDSDIEGSHSTAQETTRWSEKVTLNLCCCL